MSEPQPSGTPERPAHAPDDVPTSDAVFPPGVAPDDDAPTIISKHRPSRPSTNGAGDKDALAGQCGREGFVDGGSLRGRSLAHFELIEPIGVGGMAAVLRARDRQLDRLVALKILPPEMAADPENVRRFHQEARAAAKLDHENIARVFFCGEDQRLHFIAFEFVEGVNLRTVLERRGRLPVHEAVHYLLQIATGLAHAAARGVVHRDIKPSNIIISPNGRAKLVDMGLARAASPHDDRALTQSGVTLGTFDYIAPEQAMDPREADVRSDIYSLGCTFYHMLTGQPPVPEGTAAKKLHHHQHVAPVDPRQLNPAIPDDVAAILQRMMAKEPRERYQRAEHLVQHLIQVAQKLGAVPDLPDGVLFVDAPLPAPPRKRPLLMAAVGALALGVILIALSFAPGRPGLPRPAPHVATPGDVIPIKDKDPAPKDKGAAPVTPGGEEGRPITSERQLREALKSDAAHVKISLDGQLSLGEGTLAWAGGAERTLVIASADRKNPAVLRVLPGRTRKPKAAPWAGIELQGGTVTFRDVVFEVDTDITPDALVAGVLVKKGRVTFEGCTFTQPRAKMQELIKERKLYPVASVAAWVSDEDVQNKPHLVFRECFFGRGQAAVALVTAADVQYTNCAFGPHAVLFHFWGREEAPLRSSLRLDRVTALLVYGPALRLDNDAACDIHMTHSIISCPDRSIGINQRDLPDLIRQRDTGNRTFVSFNGRRNCYHGLEAFWRRSVAGGEPDDQWEGFKAAVKEGGRGGDDKSTYLPARSPFAAADPLKVLETDPADAFRIDLTLAAVRQSDEPELPLGVAKCVSWGPLYEVRLAKLLPEPPIPPVAGRKPNEKVVDPDAKPGTAGVYNTLKSAIADAKPGDVILIKHTGPLPVSPATLEVDHRLTIRPEGAHHPVLILADKVDKLSAALFTLSHGKLQFEKLEFRLQPSHNKFTSQAVVAIEGNGQCGFKGCVFTMEALAGAQIPLNVVELVEADGAMKMAPAGSKAPEVRLERCFVRGEGNLLAVPRSRAFVLTVEDSLVALDGTLVSVEGKEAPPGALAEVNLINTTTYLNEHLAWLRAGPNTGKGLAFTQVKAKGCLFAAAGNQPLIRIDGPDGEEQMKNVFRWVGKGNVYCGFDKVLEQKSGAEGGGRLGYDEKSWRAFANEDPEPRFVQAKFAVPPLTERLLSRAVPQDFRPAAEPRVDLMGAGADLEQLPQPSAPEPPRALEGGPPGDGEQTP